MRQAFSEIFSNIDNKIIFLLHFVFVKCIILCTFVCYWYEYDTAPSCTSVLHTRVLLGYTGQKCHPSTAAGLGWLLQCCSHYSQHHVLGVMGVSPQQGRCASAWVGYQHLYLWRCIQNRCRTKQLFPPLHWEVWCTGHRSCLLDKVQLEWMSTECYDQMKNMCCLVFE